MTTPSTHSRPRISLGGLIAIALAGVILVAAAISYAPTLRVWWSAHRYLDAVVALDCGAAARVSIYVTPAGAQCTPQSMGFPVELYAYQLTTGRISWADRERRETAAGVAIPGESRGYSLHLVLGASGWVVDSVDVGT